MKLTDLSPADKEKEGGRLVEFPKEEEGGERGVMDGEGVRRDNVDTDVMVGRKGIRAG